MPLSIVLNKNVRRGNLVVPLFSGEKGGAGPGQLAVAVSGIVVPPRAGERVTLAAPGSGFDSIVVVSLGARETATRNDVRKAGGSVASMAGTLKWGSAAVAADVVVDAFPESGAHDLAEGIVLGSFRFDEHKTGPDRPPACKFTIAVEREARRAGIREQIKRADVVGEATNLARRVGHEPANVVNPQVLASRCRAVARSAGLTCAVVDERRMRQLKMGAMLAVGAGSVSPPRLIVLEHRVGKGDRPVVLVGKAVTFDTGGYSLKDKNSIVGMKYDKCGGCTVLGILRAAADLKLKTPVVGVIAAAENMISGASLRPNDIVRSMSGRTIEIISTDAEGRLLLADALTYAQSRYKPRAIIDLATLTGGVVVALGKVMGGLFTNDDAVRASLLASGERTGERLWPLPIDDEFFESIRGDDCDMKNSAGREGHASVGAVFLKQFVDPKVPWAHLDIAGVASTDRDMPYCPKGATGFGVRLLCDYLEGLA